MSPKGGIKPHNRFSVQSKRSEVLFVDYMAEHLTPSGRAGIIVPEGIIFQSQTAYTQLRKMLVEDYLVAVVSLPAGVFNPYSGVKTSILILDKSLAKQTRHHRLLQDRERRLRPRRPAPRHREERPAAGPGRDRRIPAPPPRRANPSRRLPAHARPDRGEGEDRREWRLQPQRGAVSGGRCSRDAARSRSKSGAIDDAMHARQLTRVLPTVTMRVTWRHGAAARSRSYRQKDRSYRSDREDHRREAGRFELVRMHRSREASC